MNNLDKYNSLLKGKKVKDLAMNKLYTIKEVRYNKINEMYYLDFEEGEGRADKFNINSLENLSKGFQVGAYELAKEGINVKESLSKALKPGKTESIYYNDRTFIPVESNTYSDALKANIKHILKQRLRGYPEDIIPTEVEKIIRNDKVFMAKNSLSDDRSVAEFLYQLSLVASKLTEIKN